jgi:ribosomal protein S16
VKVKQERIDHWRGLGAKATTTVDQLLRKIEKAAAL